MTHDRLFDMPLLPHLIIDGLNRYDDRPFLFLGDATITYAQVRAETSRFAQALASKGVKRGSHTAVLSANRPEVLYNLCANMVIGSCNTPLHPLGSAEDQAYVLQDAGIETLVYDAAYFGQRAAELKERVPGLKNLLGLGPSEVGEDLNALAATFEPEPLVAPDIGPNDLNTIVYTGGTTGRPKGVRQPYRSAAYMTMIQMAEWEWPEEIRFLIATPLSHAAAAFVVPTLQSGGAFVALQGFTPGSVLRCGGAAQDYLDIPRAGHDLSAAGPSAREDGQPLEPRDPLLRSVGDEPSAPQGGRRDVGADLLPVFRAVRGADGAHALEEERPRPLEARTLSLPAGARAPGCIIALLGEDNLPVARR